MSNWKELEAARQTTASRTVPPMWCSTSADGFNGLFRITIDGTLVRCIASDGEGWRHVSVSLEYQPKACPSWKMMCKVKDLFFDPEDVVMQFHPRKSEYVNHHQGCLHLWQPYDAETKMAIEFPTPDPLMVGPTK